MINDHDDDQHGDQNGPVQLQLLCMSRTQIVVVTSLSWQYHVHKLVHTLAIQALGIGDDSMFHVICTLQFPYLATHTAHSGPLVDKRANHQLCSIRGTVRAPQFLFFVWGAPINS